MLGTITCWIILIAAKPYLSLVLRTESNIISRKVTNIQLLSRPGFSYALPVLSYSNYSSACSHRYRSSSCQLNAFSSSSLPSLISPSSWPLRKFAYHSFYACAPHAHLPSDSELDGISRVHAHSSHFPPQPPIPKQPIVVWVGERGQCCSICNVLESLVVIYNAAVRVLEDVIDELYFLESTSCFSAVDFVRAVGDSDALVDLADFLQGRGLGYAPVWVSLLG